jgi:hypothetical protein
MTTEEKVAYVLSQVACMNAELEGMKVSNSERAREGKAFAYDEKAFNDLPIRYGLTHNQVLAYLMDI